MRQHKWKVGDWVRCYCGTDGHTPTTWPGYPKAWPNHPVPWDEADCRQVGVIVSLPQGKISGQHAEGVVVHWARLDHFDTWHVHDCWGLRWCEPYTPTDAEVLGYITWLTAGVCNAAA